MGYTQSTSRDGESDSETEECNDTLYRITPAQLRTTVKIFAEHRHLKSENKLLTERISLLERSGKARDYIIQSQQSQINTMYEIDVRKDAMLMNNDAMMDVLKSQIEAERRKQKKYAVMGGCVGAALLMVLLLK